MSEQQWEEIRIEDVKPGDVARCNGREFPVDTPFAPYWKWQVQVASGNTFGHGWDGWESLGFTFHRKVKREPRSGVGVVKEHASPDSGDMNWIDVPKDIPRGTKLQWAEILDGEDGA